MKKILFLIINFLLMGGNAGAEEIKVIDTDILANKVYYKVIEKTSGLDYMASDKLIVKIFSILEKYSNLANLKNRLLLKHLNEFCSSNLKDISNNDKYLGGCFLKHNNIISYVDGNSFIHIDATKIKVLENGIYINNNILYILPYYGTWNYEGPVTFKKNTTLLQPNNLQREIIYSYLGLKNIAIYKDGVNLYYYDKSLDDIINIGKSDDQILIYQNGFIKIGKRIYTMDYSSTYAIYSEKGERPFLKRLDMVDIDSLEVLSIQYAKDNNNIYFTDIVESNNELIVSGADQKTFEVLEKNKRYAKDKNAIYVYGDRQEVDSDSWNIIDTYDDNLWSRDKNYYYYVVLGGEYVNINSVPRSFFYGEPKFLNSYCIKDNQNRYYLYYGLKKVEGTYLEQEWQNYCEKKI